MYTIPMFGVQWPAFTYDGVPPGWWPGERHRASDLEELLSSYPRIGRLLRRNTEAILNLPGFPGL